MTLASLSDHNRVEMRLARHYLNKLRIASMSVLYGQSSYANGIELFDREWEQIEHWQAHSAERSREDREWTHLCQAYSLAGLEVLSIRQNLSDQARWLEAGLQSALRLRDSQAELTILNRLSQVYGMLGDIHQSAVYADRLMKRALELKDRLATGLGYFQSGMVAEDRGLYAEARHHTLRALTIFSEHGARTDEGRALYHLGAIALYQADFEKAHHFFLRHLALMEAENNMSELCRGLLSVGQTSLLLEDFDQAEQHIRRSIRLSRELGYQRLLGAGLILLAQWYGEKGQLELELKYYQEGLAVARAVGSLQDVIHGLSNLGLTRLYMGDPQGALPELLEGLALARHAGLPRFICNIQRNIADTYLALNDPEAVRPALTETIRLSIEMGSSYQMAKALTSAIGYWRLKGRHEQAATWAGAIYDRPELDLAILQPLYRQLETALGTGAYQQALARGKGLDVSEILTTILAELT